MELQSQSWVSPTIAAVRSHAAWPSPMARSSWPSWTAHIVALDAKTGAVVWKSVIADTVPRAHALLCLHHGAAGFDGMVMVGNSGAEYPTRGFVEALDATTGKLIWRFRTTAAPDQPGGKTWDGDSWKYRRRLGVEHAGGGSQEQSGAFRHRQSQSRLLGREPQGRQCLYRLHRRHRLPAPASCAGGISKCRMMCGTMTVPRPSSCSTPRTRTARPCRPPPKPARSAMSSSSTA